MEGAEGGVRHVNQPEQLRRQRLHPRSPSYRRLLPEGGGGAGRRLWLRRARRRKVAVRERRPHLKVCSRPTAAAAAATA